MRHRLRLASLVPVVAGLAGLAALPLFEAHAALAAQARAADADTTLRALKADLDSIARAPALRGQVAGLSAMVVQGADTLLAGAYGLGSLELHVPTPADAVYEIGSVTKQFTAAAILRLAEEGRLDLDADLTEYLPEYPTGGRTIPVRRLLDHTSGIMGYTEMQAFGGLATRMLPRDSLVALFAAEPFAFEPGHAQIYNNSAYFLAGLIIEEVSGESYADYVAETFFEPLGMRRSSYCSNRVVHPGKVDGYQFNPEGLMQGGYIDHTWPYAAGSLCSSTGDMVRWLQALHGGRVLSATLYQAMIAPSALEDGTPLRYGFGLAVTEDRQGHFMIGHGGGIPGFTSDTRYYPEAELIVVVLINTIGPVSPDSIAAALASRVLGDGEAPEAAPLADPARYVGQYEGPTRGQRDGVAHIEQNDEGALTLRMGNGGAQPMRHKGDGVFQVGGQTLTFRVVDGRVTTLHLDAGGYAHYVMRRR